MSPSVLHMSPRARTNPFQMLFDVNIYSFSVKTSKKKRSLWIQLHFLVFTNSKGFNGTNCDSFLLLQSDLNIVFMRKQNVRFTLSCTYVKRDFLRNFSRPIHRENFPFNWKGSATYLGLVIKSIECLIVLYCEVARNNYHSNQKMRRRRMGDNISVLELLCR